MLFNIVENIIEKMYVITHSQDRVKCWANSFKMWKIKSNVYKMLIYPANIYALT